MLGRCKYIKMKTEYALAKYSQIIYLETTSKDFDFNGINKFKRNEFNIPTEIKIQIISVYCIVKI